jgi:hypothetical protein
MKLQLLAECVARLAECDIDNPADQKTISVCENYVLESYKYYLESCEMNGYEPLTEKEYLQNMMLNEGFFKKLLGVGAVVGGAIGAKKAYNAVNQNAIAQGQQGGIGNVVQNTKNFVQNSGGIANAASNVMAVSARAKKAANQMNNADRNTSYVRNNDGTVSTVNNGLTVKGGTGQRTVSATTNGQESQRFDANSKQAKAMQKVADQRKTTDQVNEINNKRKAELQEKINKETDNKKKEILQAELAKLQNNQTKTTNENETSTETKPLEESVTFVASELKQPLTPSIRMPASYKGLF